MPRRTSDVRLQAPPRSVVPHLVRRFRLPAKQRSRSRLSSVPVPRQQRRFVAGRVRLPAGDYACRQAVPSEDRLGRLPLPREARGIRDGESARRLPPRRRHEGPARPGDGADAERRRRSSRQPARRISESEYPTQPTNSRIRCPANAEPCPDAIDTAGPFD